MNLQYIKHSPDYILILQKLNILMRLPYNFEPFLQETEQSQNNKENDIQNHGYSKKKNLAESMAYQASKEPDLEAPSTVEDIHPSSVNQILLESCDQPATREYHL